MDYIYRREAGMEAPPAAPSVSLRTLKEQSDTLTPVETLDQLRAEIAALQNIVKGSENTEASLENSNAEWFQLGQAQNKLPGLVSMLQAVVEHLELLERSAERHRTLAHEHMRNGDTRMSVRAKTLAQNEDRIRGLLLNQLTNAWNESSSLQDEPV